MSGKDGRRERTRAAAKQATLEAAWKENANEEQSSECSPTTSEDMWKLMLEMNDKLSGIVSDNKQLSTDMNEIKQAMEFNEAKFSEMITKLNDLTEQVTRQEKRVAEIQNEVKNVQVKDEEQSLKLDELEQYSRKSSLELHGVPDSLDISCEELVMRVAKKLDVTLTSEEIDITHRLRRKKGERNPIIVKFISHKKKHELYLARSKLKNLNLGDMLNTEEVLLVDESVKSAKLFINENLTNQRRRLLGNALSLRKEKLIDNAWSLDGKIYIKIKMGDKPTLIRTEKDLAKFNEQLKSRR